MPIDKFSRMAKSLPSLYKAETNVMIRGLLKAWGVSDDQIEIQIREAKDQIFVNAASSSYLDRLASNVGVSRGPELGIEDADFRKLIPVLSYYPKQVRKTVVALLDVFWGSGFTRPNINSGNQENFNFGPAGTLTGVASFRKDSNKVIGTGTSFTTEVLVGQYIKPIGHSDLNYYKVSAIVSDTEIILSKTVVDLVAINASVAIVDPLELDYEVDNGRDRRKIRFIPNAFEDITDISVQELVDFINSNVEHNENITASVFIDPLSGNKLNIRTNTPGLLGSIQIYGGTANSPARLNFSLEKQKDVKCAVYELNPNEVVVQIPSSVPVLRRSLKGSSHPKETKAEIYSEKEVFDFSALGVSSTLTLTVDGNPYTVTFTHAQFADITAVTSEEIVEQMTAQLSYLQAFTYGLGGNYKRVGLRTTFGSSEYQITGGTANTVLLFNTALQQDPDLIQTNYPSSYIFDPVGQLFTVTGINSDLALTVLEGQVSPNLALSDASVFPNASGKILLDFGRSKQEGPITYNSRPNNSTLLIDASYVFNKEHLAGSKVNFIADGATLPRVTGDDYPVYIVGTEEARSAAQSLIRSLLAAGVVVRFIIEFPEVLFECVCRGCEPSISPDQVGSLSGSGPLTF
jgi:hypothetical protein